MHDISAIKVSNRLDISAAEKYLNEPEDKLYLRQTHQWKYNIGRVPEQLPRFGDNEIQMMPSQAQTDDFAINETY